MEHTENALQPSKKRAAGREISRDNPGLDDDEDSSDRETGTFKRASEEVLATRRMVKVRRKEKVQTEAPSSNPFAGIRLVSPAVPPAVTKPEVTMQPQAVGEETVSNEIDGKTKSGDENGKDKEAEENNEAESKAEAEPEVEAESEAKPEADNDEKKEVVPENDEKKDVTENDQKKDESASLNSFQQLSSSQNAFTSLSGTGFSSATFSFGSIKTDGSVFGTGSSPLFGLKTDQPSFGLGLGLSNNNNGSSSIFGNSSSSVLSKSEASSIPPMKEVEVETGEENEEAIFNADSVLYEFIGGGWKERGKGEVKINVSKLEKEKARLVMRARGNYRLILNASLFPDMKLTAMDKKGLSFTCANSTGEATSGGFSTFALKFKDPSAVEQFRGAVAAHKGKAVVAASALKTPENSPKASDE